MLVYNHGQPALLYLVPGVTGSLWLTGWVRGEIKDMWGYTEDGSLDVEDVVVDVEVDGEGRVVREVVVESKKEKGEGEEGEDGKKKEGDEKEKEGGEKGEKEKEDGENGCKCGRQHRDLFVFSITAPKPMALT